MSDEDQILDREQQPEEDLSTGLKVLAVLIPLAGAIMYFSNQKTNPKKATSACNMALIGFGVGVVFRVLITVASGG